MPEWTDIVRLKDRTSSPELPSTQSSVPQTEDDLPIEGCASIPGYEVIEELGRGGMGVVYKARQTSLNRLVALKVVIGGSFAGTLEKARFRMEAEAVARLHHKNIVQVYDIGKHAGIEYIAFEYVDGPTVRSWQKKEPIEPYTTARIVSDVARAVQHAHDRGIIHRDLKPANILLAGAGPLDSPTAPEERMTVPDSRAPVRVPKVMDFGLAKSIEGGSSLTQSGIACGTPNYMAPEQVKGGPISAQPAVDIWGLGAVLFEMLTGRPPFSGRDAATIMREILLSDPPSVRKFAPEVPRDLAILVAKCLEKEPARRYLSPGDVADDLDRFLGGQPILARGIGSIQRVKRWVVRNPLAASLGFVLILGLASVSILAVKLNRSAIREREATAKERSAREEAESARRAAEASDQRARSALKDEQAAVGKAWDERDRAETNLEMARTAVTNLLATISSHNQETMPALIPVYNQLLTSFEPFVAQMLEQKKGDRGLRFDQALIARVRAIAEATSGKLADGKEQMSTAANRFRELVKDYPNDRDARRELAYSEACLGSMSMELGSSDADKLLRQAQKTLEQYLADFPGDPGALDSMIRVRLAMTQTQGDPFCDEHNLAVLDLVDQLARFAELTPHHRTWRAHALNNIASNLTNRGKTDEAELYWLQVLALREELASCLPNDKVMRYELAKCLANYANQLYATQRIEPSLQCRERAAGLFDSLHEDATFRPTYVPLMVNCDLLLADLYKRRGLLDKAVNRLTSAIELNSILIKRDKTVEPVKANHARAHTQRAELSEQRGRHDLAVRDYRIAIEYSTDQVHGEYCTARLIQAYVRAGNLVEATMMASDQKPESYSNGIPCLELARSWLLIAKANGDNVNLAPAEREKAATAALDNARTCVKTAQKKELFQDSQQVRFFHSQKDFELLWDLVPRLRK